VTVPCWFAAAATLLAVYFAWGAYRAAQRGAEAAKRAEAARDEVRELQGGRHRDGND